MSLCRGCAGTGIGTHVHPREAQVAMLPVHMRRYTPTGASVASIVALRVAATESKARMSYMGPLARVLEQIELRTKAGYQIAPDVPGGQGDAPSLSSACRWCNGYGDPEGQLTVHALEAMRP